MESNPPGPKTGPAQGQIQAHLPKPQLRNIGPAWGKTGTPKSKVIKAIVRRNRMWRLATAIAALGTVINIPCAVGLLLLDAPHGLVKIAVTMAIGAPAVLAALIITNPRRNQPSTYKEV